MCRCRVISATFTTLLTDGYSYKHNILFLITYLIEHIHLYNTQSVYAPYVYCNCALEINPVHVQDFLDISF
jgi:hypothetical protein